MSHFICMQGASWMFHNSLCGYGQTSHNSLGAYGGTSHMHTKEPVGCPMIACEAMMGHLMCIQRSQWDVLY